MPVTIDPIKVEIVKQSRKQGKTKKQSLLDAGYSPRSAGHHVTNNPVLKRADSEVMKEFKLSELTPETVMNDIDSLHRLCLERGDHSTAARLLELKGKYLAIWRDRSEVTVIPSINMDDINPEKLRLKLQSALDALPKTAENKVIDVTIDTATSNEANRS